MTFVVLSIYNVSWHTSMAHRPHGSTRNVFSYRSPHPCEPTRYRSQPARGRGAVIRHGGSEIARARQRCARLRAHLGRRTDSRKAAEIEVREERRRD